MPKKTALFISGRSFNLVRSRLPVMKKLISQNWRVIAIGRSQPELDKVLRENKIEFVDMPFYRFGFSLTRDFAVFFRIYLMIVKYKPDLLHLFNPKPILLGGYVKYFFPKYPKIFCTITGMGFISGSGVKSRIILMAYTRALSCVDGIFFENENDKAVLLKRLKKNIKHTVQISSGVNMQNYQTIIPSSPFPNKIKFLFASRLLWSKGIKELLAAFDQLAVSLPNTFEFSIAGELETDHREGVPKEVLISAANKDYINYLGKVALDDMAETILNHDVIVLPSYREGFSKILMEAAAAGKTLVASDIPGCREIVIDGENGFLVPPKNTSKLFSALSKVVVEPKRLASMGENSRKMAVEQFDERIIVDKTIDFYRKCGLEELDAV